LKEAAAHGKCSTLVAIARLTILDRLVHTKDSKQQKPIAELQLTEILPDAVAIQAVQNTFVILVSRVVTKFLKHFKIPKNVVIHHIPHKYSKEMAKKSDFVS